MLCPNCKSPKVRVVDTLPLGDTEIFRRRRCSDCGHRFRSVETMDDGSQAFKYKYSEATFLRSEKKK